jgi:hypothetical protein
VFWQSVITVSCTPRQTGSTSVSDPPPFSLPPLVQYSMLTKLNPLTIKLYVLGSNWCCPKLRSCSICYSSFFGWGTGTWVTCRLVQRYGTKIDAYMFKIAWPSA